VSITVSATVGGLTLTSAPYFLDGGEGAGASGLDPGQTIYSRVWATSAYVAGAVQVMSVAGMVAETLKVFVYEATDTDASQGQLQTDLNALIAAFTVPSYTLTFNLGDAAYSWTCNNADYAIDAFPALSVFGPALGVTFDIPRMPNIGTV
jgi:hypothetical protein